MTQLPLLLHRLSCRRDFQGLFNDTLRLWEHPAPNCVQQCECRLSGDRIIRRIYIRHSISSGRTLHSHYRWHNVRTIDRLLRDVHSAIALIRKNRTRSDSKASDRHAKCRAVFTVIGFRHCHSRWRCYHPAAWWSTDFPGSHRIDCWFLGFHGLILHRHLWNSYVYGRRGSRGGEGG